MTTITNLVVALMIVTSCEEPVKAREIHQSNDEVWFVQTYGDVETLYRKTSKTNFVYSTDIDLGLIKAPCARKGCKNVRRLTAEELFGKPIRSIFFYYDDTTFCEKDNGLDWIVIGGVK